MPPVIGRDRADVDTNLFHSVDMAEHLLDLRLAYDLQQDFTARTDFSRCHVAQDVDARRASTFLMVSSTIGDVMPQINMTKIWSGRMLQTCAHIFHVLRSRCPKCGLRLHPFFTDMAKLFIDTFCFELTQTTRQRWVIPSPNFGPSLITRLTCGCQGHS